MATVLTLPNGTIRALGSRRRAALITESTSGIGLAIARACAAVGYDVMLHGPGDATDMERLGADLARAHGVTVAHVTADLSRNTGARALTEAAQAAFGRIELLVNNAGHLEVEAVEATTREQWTETMAVNLTATFQTIRQTLPDMKTNGFGRIINIASALGLVGQVACAAYAAAKHGVIGLTRSVALETAEHGITVNAICPGYVRTALVDGEIRAMARARGIGEAAAAAEILASAHPTRRFVTPEEIGALVVFLASDQAASITGAAIPIDGGWTAR